MNKIVIVVIVVLVMALGGVVALKIVQKNKDKGQQGPGGPGGSGGPGRGKDRAVAVEVEPIERRTLVDYSEFTGSLIPASRFEVAPKVPGRLEKLSVHIGQEVQSGDLIAELDGAEYELMAAQAKAELGVAEASRADSESSLNVAKRDYERARQLRDEGVSSESEFDQAKAVYDTAQERLEVAKAQIRQKEAALQASEVRQSYTRISANWAPNGGTSRIVAQKFVDEQAMLRANDPIVSIVDLSKVIAVINVIERDFAKVQVGQSATITTDARSNETFEGRVVRKAPMLMEETRQARVEIEIHNPDGKLAGGMFVRARIMFGEHKDVQSVPADAVVRHDGGSAIFVVDEGGKKARLVVIKPGIQEGEYLEVLSPEIKGSVVTVGQHLLSDGTAIMVPDKMEPGAGKPAGERKNLEK